MLYMKGYIMNKIKIKSRALSLLLVLATLLMTVPVNSFTPVAAEPAPAQPTALVTMATIKTVTAVATFLFYFSKGVTAAVDTVGVAAKEDASLLDIAATAVYSFAGKSYDPEGEKTTLYYDDYMNTVKKLRGELLSEFDKVNDNISAVTDKLNNIANEEYINNFLLLYNGGYVNLAKNLLTEYQNLSKGFEEGFSTAKEIKTAYDQLYNAAEKLESHLSYFLVTGVLSDGKMTTIQELLYNAFGEGSFEYARSLYETYMLSQYLMQLCSIYQLNYCAQTNTASYSVTGGRSFFANSIPTAMLDSNAKFEIVTERLASFFTQSAKSLNVNVSGTGIYTVIPISDTVEVTKNDVIHLPVFPAAAGMLFQSEKLCYEVSDASAATVTKDGRVTVKASSGSFSVKVSYGSPSDNNTCYTLKFTVKPYAFSGGLGTEVHPYLITTADQFKSVFSSSTYNSKHFFLGSDLDLDGATVSTLSNFYGVLDGNGHRVYDFNAVNLINENNGTIKNLTLGHPENSTSISKTYNEPSAETTYVIGTLASINNGTVTNCVMENVTLTVTGKESNNDKTYTVFLGGLVGYNKGTVSNCIVKSSDISLSITPVEKSGDDISVGAGAIAAINYEGTIESSVVRYTNLSASAYVWGKGWSNKSVPTAYGGGIASGNYGTIKHCATYGGSCTVSASGEANVTDASQIEGSITAINGGTLQYCYGTGNFADRISDGIATEHCSSFSSVSAMSQSLSVNGPLYENASGLPLPDFITGTYVACAQSCYGILGENGFNTDTLSFVLKMQSGKEISTSHFRLASADNSSIGEKSITVYYGSESSANHTVNVPCPHKNTSIRPERMATCYTDGYTEGEFCNDCQSWISGNIPRPKLGSHSYGKYSSISETQHKRICLICGEIEQGEHEWNSGETVQYPTHTATGTVKFTCQLCSHTKTEPLPTIGDHSFGNWKNFSGEKHYRECLCGETEYAVHGWNAGEITVQPTHLKEGTKQYTCTGCGATRSEAVPTTSDHAFGAWKNYSDNEHTRECPCGETEYAVHGWNAGEITVQPTHLKEGTKQYTCTGCGATRSEAVPKSDAHEFSPWKSYSELLHSHECACGAAEYENHKWGDGIPKNNPTHTSEGEILYICETCNATRTEKVDKLPEHNYVYSIVTPATATENGLGKYACACGDYYTAIIPARTITLTSEKVFTKNGNTVSVTVSISQNCGFSYLRFTLDYDSSALTLISVRNGEIIKDMDTGANILWSAAADSTATGALVTLTFRVSPYAKEGDYTVDFISRECYNAKGEDVGISFQGSSVTLIDYLDGDANGDGAINGKDVMILRKYFADLNDETGVSGVKLYYGADANGDGYVDGKDLILLRQYMAYYNDETGRSEITLGAVSGTHN